jgi:hypothetical protein
VVKFWSSSLQATPCRSARLTALVRHSTDSLKVLGARGRRLWRAGASALITCAGLGSSKIPLLLHHGLRHSTADVILIDGSCHDGVEAIAAQDYLPDPQRAPPQSGIKNMEGQRTRSAGPGRRGRTDRP